MELILHDTIACLKQGIQLLGSLTPEQYVKPHSNCYHSTIGGHLRHNLDHFLCFQAGVKSGKIDYDARSREEFLETNPEYAARKMLELTVFLGTLQREDFDRALKIKMDSGATHPETGPWSRSSLRRELQFLISHTIHHYAFIATLCSEDGSNLPKNFGVAPSTLRFRNARHPQCAL